MGWSGDLCRTFSSYVCSFVSSNTAGARDPLYGSFGLTRITAVVTPENGVQNIKDVATIAVSIFIMILYQDSDMFLSVIFGNNCSV